MTAPPALRIVRRAPVSPPHGWPAAVHPVLQHVYAARGVSCPDEVGHRLAGLLAPHGLGGIEGAVDLLAEAIARQQRVVIAGDYDCDGATGCAVAVRGLRMLGAQQVGYVVPDRAIHGYGLTPALVATMQPAPDLIVTVDNGIASLAGVAAAKARGSKVIVTDHHLPGAALPAADAIVNPNLPDEGFASKALCGVGVMFYLLLALRARLRGDGAFAHRNEPDLAALLDLVALGTVADLVPLDANNRALVEGGLRRMRAGKACAGIAALFDVSGRDVRTAVASDVLRSVHVSMRRGGSTTWPSGSNACCPTIPRVHGSWPACCTISTRSGVTCRRQWWTTRWPGSTKSMRTARQVFAYSILRGTTAWWAWSHRK